MKKTIIFMSLISWFLGLLGCTSNNGQQLNSETITQNELSFEIDKEKRDALVVKYDLLNFASHSNPTFLTLDEFFDGNNDDASIAPNLETKLNVAEYYMSLKNIENDERVIGAFAELKDVMIYENNQLNDNEWFYTDIIYFVGDISKEEVAEKVEELQPDEVEYTEDQRIIGLNDSYQGKKIVYVWWD